MTIDPTAVWIGWQLPRMQVNVPALAVPIRGRGLVFLQLSLRYSLQDTGQKRCPDSHSRWYMN